MLSDEVRESSYVSINEDDEDTVAVAHVPVRRIWTATITVGTRLPLLATGSGRVLLSGLDDKAVPRLRRQSPARSDHALHEARSGAAD